MSKNGSKDTGHYEVGYRKPPVHSRFKKGQSGNPKGRKKKQGPDIFDLVPQYLNRPITMTMGGEEQRVTALEGMIASLVQKALRGDPKAFSMVMELRDKVAAEMPTEHIVTVKYV